MEHSDPNAYKVDIEHNKKVGHNDIKLIDGTCRITKEVSHALMFHIGEYCLNNTLGFDYRAFMKLWQTNRRVLARAMFLELLINIPDVLSVNVLDFKEDTTNHILRVSYILQTSHGIVRKGFNDGN